MQEQDTSEKRCAQCGDTKPLTAFWPDKRRADGRQTKCSACKNHNRRHGAPPRPPKYALEDHGYATPCWQWQGAKNPRGYGTTWDTEAKQFVSAHRFSYTNHKGVIPEGLQIDHLCRNPSCINPEHLEAVTQSENVRRGKVARLTYADVAYMRASDESASALARRFETTPYNVRQIRAGLAWKPDTAP